MLQLHCPECFLSLLIPLIPLQNRDPGPGRSLHSAINKCLHFKGSRYLRLFLKDINAMQMTGNHACLWRTRVSSLLHKMFLITNFQWGMEQLMKEWAEI